MTPSPFVRVFVVHVGFHTLWVLVYAVSLLGVFILIPLVGWYNAFVLGFLGKSVLASATRAAFLGYVVFALTGLLSGWIVSALRPRSVWIPACLSLALTGVLLTSASWLRHKMVGVSGLATMLPLPATTGRADADQMSLALKTEYDLLEPAAPPHFSGKGILVPLAEIQPSLRLLPKNFQMQGGPYVYCNLTAEVWKALKKPGGPRYPLLWSTQPDSAGKRLVFSVDLDTDVFSDELVSDDELARRLGELEAAVGRKAGGAGSQLQQ